jgi:RNA polymerase sigma factor (sigma-70 family)
MAKQWALTAEALQLLLNWLAEYDRQAGERYETIRAGLVKLFIWHGFSDAEDLADETIDRVIRRLPELIGTYKGDPGLYFYGVAKRIIQEARRRQRLQVRLPPLDPPALQPTGQEQMANLRQDCFDECLQKLSVADRKLILQYYQARGQVKIDTRKELAQKLGIFGPNLRVKVHRIRKILHACILECLARKQAADTNRELEHNE